jgi:hypothetical protein
MKMRGRLVLPIEAFITAGLVTWAGLPFESAAGLVAVVVITDVGHVIARALEGLAGESAP